MMMIWDTPCKGDTQPGVDFNQQFIRVRKMALEKAGYRHIDIWSQPANENQIEDDEVLVVIAQS
jgi:hypothetical protein